MRVIVLALLLVSVTASAQQPADRPLRVGTKQVPPFVIREPDGSWSGISIELWERIAAELGVRYELVEMTLPELLDGVAKGTLDAGVAALSVTAAREERLDFSHPFHSSGLAIAAPTRQRGFLGVVGEILSGRFLLVIAVLLVLLIGVGLLVWLLERRRNAAQFGGRGLRGVGNGLWWSAVTMTTVGYGDKSPVTAGGRMVALVWMFASILLISTFTAAIASTLTVSRMEGHIRGPGDLTGRRVAVVTGSTGAEYVDALEAVADARVEAMVYDAPVVRYLVLQEFADRVTVLQHTFRREEYAIALPENSPLRERINRAILRITGAPRWQELLRRYLGQ
jgi:ABC-type amino acid transport substrate-binding protein